MGTERRAIGLRVGRGDVLVGPDNGLLLMAADTLGGVDDAVELHEPAYRLPEGLDELPRPRHLRAGERRTSRLGVPLERLGPTIDPATLVRLPIPEPRVTDGALETHVLYVDTFGNVKLTALQPQLAEALGPVRPDDALDIELGGERHARLAWRETFGAAGVGEPLLYEDSYGRLCLAVNQGDAATALGLTEDLPVVIRRAG